MKTHTDHGHGNAHAHEHDVHVKKVDRLSPTRVRLTVELPGETVQGHEKAMAQRFSAQARIPGFRPGKAPLNMVRDRYRDEIRREVVSHLIESAIGEALEKTSLMPVNQPKVNFKEISFDSGKPFEFDLEFEVQPEIELRHYKDVPLEKASAEVSEEEITKTLDNLRERLAALEPLESTKPEKGNFAVVEIAFDVEGAPAKKEPPKPYTIELGAGQLLPELDAALLEMTVGESRSVKAKFPEDADDKKIAGKEVTYECKLLELKKKSLPELTDAFAAQVKDGATLDELKKEIRENLEGAKREEVKQSSRQKLLDFLIDKNPFEVPSSMVEAQMHRMVQWMEEDFKKRGYPRMELTPEHIDSLKKRAENMVRGSLILKEVAVKEKIAVDESALKQRIEQIASQLNRDVEETKKFLSGKGMMDRLQDEVLTEQVYDFLMNHTR